MRCGNRNCDAQIFSRTSVVKGNRERGHSSQGYMKCEEDFFPRSRGCVKGRQILEDIFHLWK